MRFEDVVKLAKDSGVTLYVKDDKLNASPAYAVSDLLKKELVFYKRQFIEYLTGIKQPKVGIERISITDKVNGRGAWRFKIAQRFYADIHQIYRNVFTLLPGNTFNYVSSDERFARYDIDFGVDVILNQANGQSLTVQEKILTTTYNTVTVEYYQNPIKKIEGDWFNLKCDYYFVGYGTSKSPILDRWILLDWNQVRLNGDRIKWEVNKNTKDGARANFKYADFCSFPDTCVVAMRLNGSTTINKQRSNNNGFCQLGF